MSILADQVKAHYDETMCFTAWQATCRAVMGRRVPPLGMALDREGFEKLPCLPREFALDLRRRIDGADLDWLGNYHQYAAVGDRDLLRKVYEEIFSAPVDARIASFFGSEYLIYSSLFRRTFPDPGFDGTFDPERDEGPTASFLWHRDGGPRSSLVMLIYLDDAEGGGGATECVSLAETDAISDAGYDFPPMNRRTSDLTPFALRAGIEHRPVRPVMAAGGGLILRARDSLHRAVMPQSKVRPVLHLIVLPSVLPWREALDAWWPEDRDRSGEWHIGFMTALVQARGAR